MNSEPRTKVVIVGAGYAGLMTALRLAGKDRARKAEITLVNASDGFVERIRNHQLAAGQPVRPHPIRKLLGRHPIDFVQGRVAALDLAGRRVRVDGPGGARFLAYDQLVYALGSVAAQPALPGLREHAYGVANAPAARGLQARLAQLAPGDRVAVVGGGLTGIETAAEVAEAYPRLQVSLVTAGEPGAGLSDTGRDYLGATLSEMGVRVMQPIRVVAIEPDGLVTSQGEHIPAQVSVWAGSFVAPPLAGAAGLAVNGKGQVLVDPALNALGHPDVFVAGDAADPVEDPGAPMRMSCAVALPMGAHVADNLLARLYGEPTRPFRYQYTVQCISLGRHRGLLQFVNGDDSPQARIWTGRKGAIAKELICQYAFRSLQLEGLLPGAQRWPGRDGGARRRTEELGQHA